VVISGESRALFMRVFISLSRSKSILILPVDAVVGYEDLQGTIWSGDDRLSTLRNAERCKSLSALSGYLNVSLLPSR